MYHLKENCDCKTFHESTGICTLCARHNHEDFIRHLRNGTNSNDQDEQWLLEQMRNKPDHGYRKGKERVSKCGHPGIYRGNKCALCLKISSDKREKKGVSVIDSMKVSLVQLEQTINEMNSQCDTLRKAIQLSEMGLNVGNIPLTIVKVKTPRQVAIESGQKWYIPYEPCKNCNKISERYVANGRCRNCGGK